MDNEKQIISNFYNEYELIKFGDPEALKKQNDVMKKQMEDLVNKVLPALVKIAETDSEMPVGMLLASLVSENLVQEDKFIEVQNNLKELKKLGDLLNLDKRLVGILSAIVP